MKTIILSAGHTPDSLPENTGCTHIIAGSALLREKIPADCLRDDSGENISVKNREYCELTALYWAWKNLDAEIIGLCHYRRFFASPSCRGSFLQPDEADYLLRFFDVLLPSERNYIFETNYTQYCNSHNAADLDLTRSIIMERHPEYLEAFETRMSMTKGHRFNMFVMRKPLADEYCEWLFDILSELEKRLDISCYTERDRRVFGFVAERLLDVWMDANGLHTTDLDYIFIGKEHLARKALAMTVRKIRAGLKNAQNRLNHKES